MDNSRPGRKFGDVLVAPLVAYKAGDTAVAQFVAANPRVSGHTLYLRARVDACRSQNNLRLEQTFLTVERLQNNVWTAVRSDSHPSTKFEWLRTNALAGYSTVNITW
jgi:neutral ceramidase